MKYYQPCLKWAGKSLKQPARIFSWLMSAYLDADIGGGKMQLSGPVTVRGRPTMLAWFEDVQVGWNL